MKVSPFKYSGRKLEFVDKINGIYKNLFFNLDTSNLVYVEPYAGSASVFFNLVSDFKHYIISDIDRNVIRIHKSIKEADYKTYKAIIDSVSTQWGDIQNSKKSYYDFRLWFNTTVWKTDTIEEGIYLQVLYGSCINSMARFGANGFNQGFGNRFYTVTEEEYEILHRRLQKADLYNMSFEDLKKLVLSKWDLSEVFLFLDPPYINRPSSYRTLEDHEYTKFITYLETTPSKWIYTDIHEDQIKAPYIVLREQMVNTGPGTKKEKLNNKEVAFYNF